MQYLWIELWISVKLHDQIWKHVYFFIYVSHNVNSEHFGGEGGGGDWGGTAPAIPTPLRTALFVIL